MFPKQIGDIVKIKAAKCGIRL